MDELTISKLKADNDRLTRDVQQLKKDLDAISALVISPRVSFENFEGSFKTLSTAPTTTNFQNGSLVLSDVSGTRKINVRINGAWYSVTVT